MLIARLLPLTGLFAVFVYVAKADERRQVGFVTIGLSRVAFIAWIGIMSGSSSGAGYGY